MSSDLTAFRLFGLCRLPAPLRFHPHPWDTEMTQRWVHGEKKVSHISIQLSKFWLMVLLIEMVFKVNLKKEKFNIHLIISKSKHFSCSALAAVAVLWNFRFIAPFMAIGQAKTKWELAKKPKQKPMPSRLERLWCGHSLCALSCQMRQICLWPGGCLSACIIELITRRSVDVCGPLLSVS